MSPAFDYIGRKPETIVGLDPKNISEEQYDALPWELQQAVLNNRGSDGGPLYQERPSRADRKRVRDLMGPEPDTAVDSDTDDAAEPAGVPDVVVEITPEPATEPDVPAVPAEEGGTA